MQFDNHSLLAHKSYKRLPKFINSAVGKTRCYINSWSKKLLCKSWVLPLVVMLLTPTSPAPSHLAFSSEIKESSMVNEEAKRSWGALKFLGPDTVADVAATVAPWVVNIDVAVESDGQSPRNKTENELRPHDIDRLYKPFGVGPPNGNPPKKGTGSGIVLKPDGIILTCNHVINDAGEIKVTLSDGRTFIATVLGRDTFSDLAVLKVATDGLPSATFAKTDCLRVGDWVLAVGSPLGLDHTVTLGIISALGREAKGLSTFGARSGAVRFIQTDAAINPGNSGGPLVNLKGEVIGVNTFIHGSAQNIGFAIPADMAKQVADKLAQFHVISHPFIGIVMTDLDGETKQREGLPTDSFGVLVRSVMPKSPAFVAGLLPGDLILQIDDQKIEHSGEVSEMVRHHGVGEQLKMVVRRLGDEKTIRVKIEKLPDEAVPQ